MTGASLFPVPEPVDGGLLVTFGEPGRSWAGMHGGLVVGTLAEAVATVTGRSPLAVTAHLHGPVEPGEATVRVSETVAGRSVTSATAALDQGRRRATASVLVGDPEDEVTVWPPGLRDLSHLPAPESIEPLTGYEQLMPVARYFDVRRVSRSGPLEGGADPVLGAWIRLLPALPYSAGVAALLLDALLPSLYAVRTTPVAIPTVEFTLHLRPGPVDTEWFFLEQRTTWSTGDLCVDEAELRTPDGRLVASSRQLRRILPG